MTHETQDRYRTHRIRTNSKYSGPVSYSGFALTELLALLIVGAFVVSMLLPLLFRAAQPNP